MTDDQEFNWRNLNVKREKKHEWLIERFCPSEAGHEPVFRYIKDFMIFSAFVGHYHERFLPLVSSDTIPITLNTYSTDRKDYFIYLLALVTTKDPEILKDDGLPEAIKIFEGYSNGGLEVIGEWLEDNAKDPNGVETLLQHIHSAIFDSTSSEVREDGADDVEF